MAEKLKGSTTKVRFSQVRNRIEVAGQSEHQQNQQEIYDYRKLLNDYVPDLHEGEWGVLVIVMADAKLEGSLYELAQVKFGDRVMDHYGLENPDDMEMEVQLMVMKLQDLNLAQRVAVLRVIRQYVIATGHDDLPDGSLKEQIEFVRARM